MDLVCLDMEGVLTPEIWIEFSRVSGIPELRRTTRDEPDYRKLMHWRMGILKEHGLGLKEIQAVIDEIEPLPGARAFLDALRDRAQAVILSDTFQEFAKPLLDKLGRPTIFCNSLVSKAGFLFRTTDQIRAAYPQLPAFTEYDDLLFAITGALS